MAWILLFWVSQEQNQSAGRPVFLSGNSEGESTYKFIQVVGRNQFHVVVGLRSQFPCWLLAGGHSQFLEATHIPWLLDSFLCLQTQQLWVKSLFVISVTTAFSSLFLCCLLLAHLLSDHSAFFFALKSLFNYMSPPG